MKFRLTALLGLFLLSGAAAWCQTAVVHGNIKGLKDPHLVFYYKPAGEEGKRDTVKVNNGQFTWKGKLDEPVMIRIFFANRLFSFYAENGTIHLNGVADSINQIKVTGSKLQDESIAYDKAQKGLNEEQSALYKNYGKGSKEEQLELEKKIEALVARKRKVEKAYIAAYPNSFYSTLKVSERASGYGADYQEVMDLFKLLGKKQQESKTGKAIIEQLQIVKRSNIGELLQDFAQQDTSGNTVQLSSFRGKYVFVDFWASWCGPCRAENPNVLRAYNEFKDKNFTVVGISIDDKRANWVKAIIEDKMPWTQLSDLKGSKNEVSTYYGIMGIPSSFLVDPSGKIVARNLRGEMLHAKLKELIN